MAAGRLPSGENESSSSAQLLRTISLAAGRARHGSIVGWDSLEGIEDSQSEITSEAGLTGPFSLHRISHASLPTLKGRYDTLLKKPTPNVFADLNSRESSDTVNAL